MQWKFRKIQSTNNSAVLIQFYLFLLSKGTETVFQIDVVRVLRQSFHLLITRIAMHGRMCVRKKPEIRQQTGTLILCKVPKMAKKAILPMFTYITYDIHIYK